ncbi:MAG TPA: hypothetical protein VM367_05730 [Pseudonocardia sp.]|jgi:hypothetical protein|nr:hypothetical protein [Pseudonocardia sp.]
MLTAYGERGAVREALRLLAEILTQGRACLVSVMGYVQEPSKDVIDVRELFTTPVCLGVTAASHVDMVLGDGARERGALADEIPGDEATPVRVRCRRRLAPAGAVPGRVRVRRRDRRTGRALPAVGAIGRRDRDAVTNGTHSGTEYRLIMTVICLRAGGARVGRAGGRARDQSRSRRCGRRRRRAGCLASPIVTTGVRALEPFPKTTAGRRTVPLRVWLVVLLREHVESYPRGEAGLIFANQVGGAFRLTLGRAQPGRRAALSRSLPLACRVVRRRRGTGEHGSAGARARARVDDVDLYTRRTDDPSRVLQARRRGRPRGP